MKRLLITLLLCGAGFASAAEFAGNVGYFSDYRFRGISQGDRSPAIQGGFDIAFDGGFYLGTWASNVAPWSDGTIELDWYGGWAMDLNDSSAIDIGVWYYGYPEDNADPGLDFVEIYGNYSFQDFTLGVAYSPDYFAETDSFFYVFGDYSFGLTDNLSLDLHLGFNIFNDKDAGAAFGIGEVGDPKDRYIDYAIGLSTSALGVDWGLQFIGTDLSDAECFDGFEGCEETIVVSVSKSL
ncbi:MAG: TorF family putative porin [Gammaproteobacteria bacterium]|nr:TorF family putative porin [Gammaproteobacteria bacterium]